jgi:hypothetical protein
VLISWITWSPCSDTTTLDDYIDTPDDTAVEGEVQEGRRYTEAEFNRIIEIERRERQRVEILLSQIDAEQLAEMQTIISAEHSDLFDVLAHVAYALPPIPRESRAQQARLTIHSRFSSKQQVFLNFVLQHYVSSGVQELAQEKLAPLLRLRYRNSIADAVADLGQPEEIGRVFASFQRSLDAPAEPH